MVASNYHYNETFMALLKVHVGGNRNLTINFAWPYTYGINVATYR